MLSIYHSNRLDILKDLLVELLLREPLQNPLQNEQILVQSPGMAQWLRLQLAEGLGIAAAMEFPLPASFLWKMYTRVLPDVPTRSAFNKEAMSWKIMSLLPEMIEQPAFASLKQYLSDDDDGIRCFQLAGKIADIFDQYLVYRPDWINEWEQNNDSNDIAESHPWQPELWRTLVAKTDELKQSPWHRANMHHRFIEELTKNDHKKELPQRLFVFGISALPPHFVESLQAIASQTEVHLMIMNPCQHYWGDERDSKYLRKMAARRFQDNTLAKAVTKSSHSHEHWLDKPELSLDNLDDIGNPLLGSMGKLGRDYFHQLHDLNAFDVDVFVQDHSDSLLHQIQQDILNLNNRTEQPVSKDWQPDHSLQFHNCFSPMREMEVLQDRLLDMFEQNPKLQPRDIVVMLPDIDSYSPWIQAVFGSTPYDDKRFIPFSISDRSASSEHPILPAVLKLLDLDQSRCTAPELLELLEVPAIQSRFELNSEDLETLRHWVDKSGIRWGLNASHQGQFGVPELKGNTWSFGLKRMLLGYAMSESVDVYEGILPFEQVQGMSAVLAGQLASFIALAEQLAENLNQPRTIEQWISDINRLLEDFFSPAEDDEYALKIVRDAFERLHEQLADADHQAPLSRTIVYSYLSERLTSERSSQRFLAGQVNFCTLMPMRSIPFKVVCLLGMNDGAYPRTIAPAGFDLIAKHWRRGDRSRREDDRYLFLEALLSAQQTLYISYVGHRIQDGTERIPSVLVSELLDYCEQGFDLKPKRMITQHSLQAFSPDQFKPDSDLFSYAREWLPAAARQGEEPQPFISQALPAETSSQEIELAALLRFYNNPCKHFCNRRLKVFFEAEEQALEDTEPFAIEGLSNYLLQGEILESLIKEEPETTLKNRLAARGILPHAAFGQLWLQEQLEDITDMADSLRPILKETPEDIEIDESIGNHQLTGWLRNSYADGLLRYRPAKTIKGKDITSAWIEHLCLCLKRQNRKTRLIFIADEVYFEPVSQKQAYQYLEQLIDIYNEGQSRPLPWFPQTAYSLLNANEGSEQTEAEKAFYGGQDGRPPRAEKADSYIGRIFPELELSEEDSSKPTEFEQYVTVIMSPALDFMRKV